MWACWPFKLKSTKIHKLKLVGSEFHIGVHDFNVGKRSLSKKGSLQKGPFSRDARDVEMLEILDRPQSTDKQGEDNRVLDILETLDI